MTAPTRPTRPDASMTLLNEVVERPLDPGYADSAARRRALAEAGLSVRRRPARLLALFLVAVLLGGMTVAAARQLRVPREGVAAARALLEQQIADRAATADELRQRSSELSAEIEELQRTALSGQDPALLEDLRLDGVVNGSTPVSGPGLVVSLTDGGRGLTEEDVDPSSRVLDIDVQTVVNALWSAGAEAISVDDQRLTAMSAIRNAGDAILVDLVPLTGPTYVIRAVGDPEAMQTAYARSDAPTHLQGLAAWGIESSVITQSSLTLPGVGTQSLSHARVLDSGASGAAPPDSTVRDDSQEATP